MRFEELVEGVGYYECPHCREEFFQIVTVEDVEVQDETGNTYIFEKLDVDGEASYELLIAHMEKCPKKK